VGLTTIPLGLNFWPPNLFGGPLNLENPEKGLLGGFVFTTLFDFVMQLLYNTFITSFVRPPITSESLLQGKKK